MTSSDNLSLFWDPLKSGIDSIFKLEHINPKSYMHMYSYVYNYCSFVDQRQPTTGRMDQATGGGKLVGLELYKKLKEYLRKHVYSLKAKGDGLTGEEMLSYFDRTWIDFDFASKVLDGVCRYLNRHWVKRECEEGRKHVYNIKSLALITWREHLLKPHVRVLVSALLREIECERRGELLCTNKLRNIINSFVDLGITSENQSLSAPSGSSQYPTDQFSSFVANRHPQIQPPNIVGFQQPDSRTSASTVGVRDPTNSCGSTIAALTFQSTANYAATPVSDARLSVYQDYFERAFLVETERFYRLESAQFLESNSIPEYLQKVEKRLHEERNRVHTYLHISTLPKLIHSCEHYLLREHLDRLTSEFVHLLSDDREQDICLMYKLIGHFPNAMDVLVTAVEAHVEAKGTEALRQVVQTAITDPKLYITTILQVHRKYYNLVRSAFASDHSFARALDKGCELFINRNAITEMAGSVRKSPELLAKYADFLLKKSPRDVQTDDLEDVLGQVMTVFKYVEDKDVFQKFYSKTLARRLVNNQSISEDAEASMISKLKESCGFEYTAKLQRMFQDVNATRDLNSKFMDYIQSHETTPGTTLKGIDFNIMILSSNAWPYQAQTAFSIPAELEQCKAAFYSFYQEHHTGRKLNWCYQLSRGELVTNYTKARYTLQVSTYQISILMLYNTALVYSVNEIQSHTSIEMSTLIQTLQTLIKAKVFKPVVAESSALPTIANPSIPTTSFNAPSDATGPDQQQQQPLQEQQQQLTPTTLLALNTDFKNKRVRVYLNVPLKCETKQETEQTLGNVDLDRKLNVQACIVRIMKARKMMKHQQLINEVISQLSTRFKPSIKLIKDLIADLIDKEYMQRCNNDRDSYEYMA